MFETPVIAQELRLFMKPFIAFKKFFNPAVTTYNPGFWAYSNILRDNSRNVLNLFAILNTHTNISKKRLMLMPFTEYPVALFKGMAKGIKYVKGDWDEDIRSLLKEGSLFSGFYDRYNLTEGQDLLRPIFVANNIIDKSTLVSRAKLKWNSPKQVAAFENFAKLMEYSQVPRLFQFVRTVATVTEISSKFAGQHMLKKYLPKEAVNYFTRSYIGTPNGRDKAMMTPVLDGIFPFYNMILQSLRTGAELGFNKKTAGAYWLFQGLTGAFPGAAMAVMGALGLWLKDQFTDEEIAANPLLRSAEWHSRMYNKISSYDRYNYLCFIFGETEEGDPIYWRIQLGEEQKLMYSFTQWSAKSILEKNVRDFDKILNIGLGLTPSNSPLLTLAKGWSDYAGGNSPIDNHYHNRVVPDVRMRAGVKYSAPYMVKWTMDKAGLRPVTKILFKNGLKEGQRSYQLNNIPFNRMLKVGGKGESEMYDWVASKKSHEEALMSVWLQDKTTDIVTERLKNSKENPIDDYSDRIEITYNVYEEYLDEFGDETALDPIRIKKLVNSYVDLGKNHRYHNIIEPMIFKPTTAQKVEILLTFRKNTSYDEFQDLTNYMLENKIISSGLYRTYELRRDEFERTGK
jgi:hypothetical protein